MIDELRDVMILTGPTGSGKTDLGLALAAHLGAEIVSMDSMALYRGMDIGTAKATPAQRELVPHHLVDVLDPWESASVAWWLEEARRCCAEIRKRDRRILFVGGTPLYVKALLRGLFDGPAADEQIRERLANAAREQGVAALHQRLAQADPVSARRVHPNDARRIIRALEVFELTGRPMSDWQQQWHKPGDETRQRNIHAVWLDLPRKELYARIDKRVEAMFASGFVDEVRRLRAESGEWSAERGGWSAPRSALRALGYLEVFDYLDGKATLEETIREVQTRTRNYAKRQITWFRHLPEVRPVESHRLESHHLTCRGPVDH